MNHSKIYFDHEKLIAYQRSIEFVAWGSQPLEELPAKLAVCDQLDRASESVSLLIGLCKSISPDRLGEEAPPIGHRLEIKSKSMIKIKNRPANFTKNTEEPGRELA